MAYESRRRGYRDRNWEVAERQLEDVREMAWNNNLKKIYFNLRSKVISFAPFDYQAWGVRGRMNVYFSTGTVGTCLYHHRQGRTQLYRRDVSPSTLEGLMRNPRLHTGVGYYRIVQIPRDRDPSSEKFELDEHERLWREEYEEDNSNASEADQEDDGRRYVSSRSRSRDRSRDRSQPRDRHHDPSRDRRDSNVRFQVSRSEARGRGR